MGKPLQATVLELGLGPVTCFSWSKTLGLGEGFQAGAVTSSLLTYLSWHENMTLWENWSKGSWVSSVLHLPHLGRASSIQVGLDVEKKRLLAAHSCSVIWSWDWRERVAASPSQGDSVDCAWELVGEASLGPFFWPQFLVIGPSIVLTRTQGWVRGWFVAQVPQTLTLLRLRFS